MASRFESRDEGAHDRRIWIILLHEAQDGKRLVWRIPLTVVHDQMRRLKPVIVVERKELGGPQQAGQRLRIAACGKAAIGDEAQFRVADANCE
jgi:hypothetical protein